MMEMFKKDNILVGFFLSLAITFLNALVIYVFLRFMNMDVLYYAKAFLFSIVGEIFLLRFYAKNKISSSLLGAVLCLFVTGIVIIISMLSRGYIGL